MTIKKMPNDGGVAYHELLKEQAYRMKFEKYRYFTPNGKGSEYLEEAFSGKYFITVFSAANGVGKTATVVNALANLMFPCGNKWFQQPLMRNWIYPKKGRIVSDPENIRNVLVPTLKEWFPSGRFRSAKHGKDYDSFFVTETGWEFSLMTYDQDPKEFESATLGFCVFDEPPPESIYKATIARFRKGAGGIILIVATPLAGCEWMYDQLIINKDNETGMRAIIQADIESACKIHGVRGHLEHSTIKKIVSQYTEDEKQARIFGKFQHLTGIIFKNFDRKIHVINPFEVSRREFSVIELLDPHPRTPDAVMWLATDKNNTHYVVDELYMKCQGGDQELAQYIKSKADRFRVTSRYVDPSAMIEDQHTGTSLAQRLSNNGLSYMEATKARQMSDRRIYDALNYVKVGENIIKTPELYIFSTCARTIWELEHYRWDDWTGKSVDKHDKKQKPLDKDDHCLTGNTLIDCQDGQYKIIDLVGRTGLVKTPNGLRKFFNVRKTRDNAKIYRITLDNGKYIEATPDHLILSRKNGWKELQSFKIGEMILDIGEWSRYTWKYGSKNIIKNTTRVQWGKILALWKLLYQKFKESSLKENEILWQKMQGERMGAVKEIKYIGIGSVFNMEVELEHCFSVNNGLIVHNCIENLGRGLFSEPPFIPEYIGTRSIEVTPVNFDPYS